MCRERVPGSPYYICTKNGCGWWDTSHPDIDKITLSPEFRTESPVTVRERLGSGGIPTATPIPRKTEGRINVKGAD